MISLIELKGRAEELGRRVTENSITPKDVSDLFSDTITALSEIKQIKFVQATLNRTHDRHELNIEAGKNYILPDEFVGLHILPLEPSEDNPLITEITLYFHTGKIIDGGRIGLRDEQEPAPYIMFNNVLISSGISFEKNKFYEVSLRWNPLASKYTALVSAWDVGQISIESSFVGHRV